MKNSNNSSTEDFKPLPSFDWDKAKYFFYVVKFGSLTEAGRFLNISQSSLSRKIIVLEHNLKFKLFKRTKIGFELTRKGEEFFKKVERVFLIFKEVTYNSTVTEDNGQKRKIRISATHAVSSYILSEHLINYNKLHPNIIFEIITHDHLIDLIINDVDLAIRPYDIEARGVQQKYLFSLEKKLFASLEYLERHGEPQNIDDLRRHHIVAPAEPEKHPYADLDWIFKLGMPIGERRKPVFTSNSLECLVKAAKNGLGLIGGYEEMEIIREAGFKRILETLKGPLIEDYMIYPMHLEKDKIFKEFIVYLSNVFSKSEE